jgi:hypothetical protein
MDMRKHNGKHKSRITLIRKNNHKNSQWKAKIPLLRPNKISQWFVIWVDIQDIKRPWLLCGWPLNDGAPSRMTSLINGDPPIMHCTLGASKETRHRDGFQKKTQSISEWWNQHIKWTIVWLLGTPYPWMVHLLKQKFICVPTHCLQKGKAAMGAAASQWSQNPSKCISKIKN